MLQCLHQTHSAKFKVPHQLQMLLCTYWETGSSQFPIDYMHLMCLGVEKISIIVVIWAPENMVGQTQCRESEHKAYKIEKKSATWVSAQTMTHIWIWKMECDWISHVAALYRLCCFKWYPTAELYQKILLLSVGVNTLVNLLLYSQYINWQLFVLFVDHFAKLYGSDRISYNVHALVHLSSETTRFGVLDNVSAFPFENFLGKLKNLSKNSFFVTTTNSSTAGEMVWNDHTVKAMSWQWSHVATEGTCWHSRNASWQKEHADTHEMRPRSLHPFASEDIRTAVQWMLRFTSDINLPSKRYLLTHFQAIPAYLYMKQLSWVRSSQLRKLQLREQKISSLMLALERRETEWHYYVGTMDCQQLSPIALESLSTNREPHWLRCQHQNNTLRELILLLTARCQFLTGLHFCNISLAPWSYFNGKLSSALRNMGCRIQCKLSGSKQQYRAVCWSNARQATKDLAVAVCGKAVLAASSLTGQPSLIITTAKSKRALQLLSLIFNWLYDTTAFWCANAISGFQTSSIFPIDCKIISHKIFSTTQLLT